MAHAFLLRLISRFGFTSLPNVYLRFYCSSTGRLAKWGVGVELVVRGNGFFLSWMIDEKRIPSESSILPFLFDILTLLLFFISLSNVQMFDMSKNN